MSHHIETTPKVHSLARPILRRPHISRLQQNPKPPIHPLTPINQPPLLKPQMHTPIPNNIPPQPIRHEILIRAIHRQAPKPRRLDRRLPGEREEKRLLRAQRQVVGFVRDEQVVGFVRDEQVFGLCEAEVAAQGAVCAAAVFAAEDALACRFGDHPVVADVDEVAGVCGGDAGVCGDGGGGEVDGARGV